jgi:hypothetical protein
LSSCRRESTTVRDQARALRGGPPASLADARQLDRGRNFTPGRLGSPLGAEAPPSSAAERRCHRALKSSRRTGWPKFQVRPGRFRPGLRELRGAAAFEPRNPAVRRCGPYRNPGRASATDEAIFCPPQGADAFEASATLPGGGAAHLRCKCPDPGSRRSSRSGVDTNASTSAALALRRASERFARRPFGRVRNSPPPHECRGDLTSGALAGTRRSKNARWRSKIAHRAAVAPRGAHCRGFQLLAVAAGQPP